jgi:hypothetical protein
MAHQPRLPMALGSSRQFEPVSYIAEGAKNYAESKGLSYSPKGLENTRVDPVRGWSVGQELQKNMKDSPTPETLNSYEALRKETVDQYNHMTKPVHEGGMGVRVEVTDDDPYGDPKDLAADLRNRQIKVLSTKSTGPHGYFTDEENDMFRAVHDVFGHAGIGRDFGRHGEEAAYQSHRQMFSPAAHDALVSETRGQNSYLNYISHGDHFPDNVPVNMPKWTQSTGKFRGIPEERAQARERKRGNKEMSGEQLKFDI